jgi:hypothetical protein
LLKFAGATIVIPAEAKDKDSKETAKANKKPEIKIPFFITITKYLTI